MRVERQVEFLGRDLGERGQDTLAELDLAGEDGRGAVGVDADPAVELAVVLQAARQPGRLLRESELRIEREGDHDRAEPGGELTSIDGGSVHGQVLPLAWAARSTARMMRLWVPQRQRLPSSAARTSCSLGRGLRSSSSFADMIMPLMQ